MLFFDCYPKELPKVTFYFIYLYNEVHRVIKVYK